MPTDPYAKFRSGDMKQNVVNIADELQKTEQEIAKTQERLEGLEAYKNFLSQRMLPEATGEMEGKWKLPDGRSISVTESIRAHVSREHFPRAAHWLEENGHAHIIKRKLQVSFSTRNEACYQDVMLALKKFPGAKVEDQHSIHHGTATSWVKSALEQGLDFPQDVFGVQRVLKAKISDK